MKLYILTMIATTMVAAIIFALLRTGWSGFFVAFLHLNILQFILSIWMLYSICAVLDQHGKVLDLATLPGFQTMKKIWCFSLVCTAIVWWLIYNIGLDNVYF